MGSQRFWRVFCAGLFALTVTGCGGGGANGGFGDGTDTGSGGGTGGGGTGGGDGGAVTPVPRLGVLNGTSFTQGAIAIGQSPLAAGGTSGLRVNIVDTANGNTPITDEVSVVFSSSCISDGTSAVTPNPATTSTGAALVSYRAQGCEDSDVITATALVGGSTQSATGTISVLPAELGSVKFVSATPTTIFIPGSGGDQTSDVVFQVLNDVGSPAANKIVTFALDSTVGGTTLSSNSGTTDNNGNVSVTVNAGLVHTTVVVTASVNTGTEIISGQSALLTINAGLPDQDSFSLAVECQNVEALTRFGVQVPITIFAAGRDNNPVSNGRSVAFSTEGGSVSSSCSTVNGTCSGTWLSQLPIPQGFDDCAFGEADFENDAICAFGGRPGRSTVLATAQGEESFTDVDSDGLRDDTEVNNFSLNDLPEAFRDDDEDGVFDTLANGDDHDEIPVDFNTNGVYDDPDGQFNGLYCDAGSGTPVLCALPRSVSVRTSNLIIMSGSQPAINLTQFPSGDVFVGGAGVAYDGAGTVTVPNNGVATIGFVIRDVNNQPMPGGSSVAFTASGDGTIPGTSTFTVMCTSNDTAVGNLYTVQFKAPALESGDEDGFATFEMKVTTPGAPKGSATSTVIGLAVTTTAPP